MKKIAAGLILDKNGDILLARRAKTEPLANWYEFPGGKLEESETPEMALVRELKEELGINSEILSFFKSTLYKYDTGTIKIYFYWVKTSTLKEKFKKNVHDNFVWISPYDFPKYKILPGDHDVCFKLVNYYYNNGKKFPDYLLNKI